MRRSKWPGVLVTWLAALAVIWAARWAQVWFGLSVGTTIIAGGLLLTFVVTGVYGFIGR